MLRYAAIFSLITACRPSGERCWTNSDCVGLAICTDNRCHPAIPVGGFCLSNDECEVRKGQACIAGLCMQSALKPPKSLPHQQICTDHNQCVGQAMCVAYTCVPAITSGATCTSDSHCLTGETCNYGDCWKPLTGATPNGCTSHSACPGSQLCQLGACRKAKKTNVFCIQDSQCYRGGCKDFTCYRYRFNNPAYVECISHADCSGQQLCRNHKCITGIPIGVQCTSPKACPGSSVCKHGTCFATGLYNSPCVDHENCNGQQLCRLGQCKAAVPNGQVCGSFQTCHAGSYCKMNNCLEYFN